MIVFVSTTGKVRAFISKLKSLDKSIETLEVENGKEIVGKEYLLVTHTTNVGEMPSRLVDFINNKDNLSKALGVVGSGNKNWGDSYCGGAYKASELLGVPMLHTFENRGNGSDVSRVFQIYEDLKEISNGKMD